MKKLKEIQEAREEHRAAMIAIMDKADGEERAINEEEQAEFTKHEQAIKDLDAHAAAVRAINATELDPSTLREGDGKADDEKRGGEEQRAMDPIGALLRGDEKRAADDGMTTTSDGPVLSESFSGDIIKNVRERAGIYADVGQVNIKGTYKQIVAENMITAAWTEDELETLIRSDATYTTIPIGHHTCGSLAIISNEAIEDTAFNVTEDVVDQIIDALNDKLENSIIDGNGVHKPTGLLGSGTPVPLAAPNTITADEIIRTAMSIKASYWPNASWRINRATLEAILKLKDAQGQYLFRSGSMEGGFAGTILGKPVKISEFIPSYQLLYGDFKRGYKTNTNPYITVQILKERFAELVATGIIGTMRIDGKPIHAEAYAVAKYTAPAE
jgi:HK97 family phage major capsid protein